MLPSAPLEQTVESMVVGFRLAVWDLVPHQRDAQISGVRRQGSGACQQRSLLMDSPERSWPDACGFRKQSAMLERVERRKTLHINH